MQINRTMRSLAHDIQEQDAGDHAHQADSSQPAVIEIADRSKGAPPSSGVHERQKTLDHKNEGQCGEQVLPTQWTLISAGRLALKQD